MLLYIEDIPGGSPCHFVYERVGKVRTNKFTSRHCLNVSTLVSFGKISEYMFKSDLVF